MSCCVFSFSAINQFVFFFLLFLPTPPLTEDAMPFYFYFYFLECLKVVQQIVREMSAIIKWMWHIHTRARAHVSLEVADADLWCCVAALLRAWFCSGGAVLQAWRGKAGESLCSPTSLYIYSPIYSASSLECEGRERPQSVSFLPVTQIMQPRQTVLLIELKWASLEN